MNELLSVKNSKKTEQVLHKCILSKFKEDRTGRHMSSRLVDWSIGRDGSPYVKSTGRLCVDYRRLNNRTDPDNFPMPRIYALLNWLGGATIMTKIDMTRGYWHVPIAPSDVELTGFVNSHGHYH